MSKIPNFIYGTAWKENDTAKLTELALKIGFKAIDTANQRKHYYEQAVGDGIAAAIQKQYITREQLFLQSKYTFPRGHDHRKPFDENSSFSTQVVDSFASSLENLNTDYIDSYILHGPYSTSIHDADIDAWSAMESLVDNKKVHYLGISNVSKSQLEEIYNQAKIKPTFVQNRCFANLRWDHDVRQFCKKHNILYQGFSLLTANQHELLNKNIVDIAKRLKLTIPQLVFKYSTQLGIIPLTGTSNAKHMQQDLEHFDILLNNTDIEMIENISFC